MYTIDRLNRVKNSSLKFALMIVIKKWEKAQKFEIPGIKRGYRYFKNITETGYSLGIHESKDWKL